MTRKPIKPNSWNQFFRFELFLSAWMTPFLFLMIRQWPGNKDPGLVPALVAVSLFSLTAIGLGAIHRAISGRNNSLGFFYLMPFVATTNITTSLVGRPLKALIGLQGILFLVFALFVLVIEFVQLWWKRRKRRKPSIALNPLLDDNF